MFGNYELLDEVGHGGMGVIYRARDLPLNRVVALKLMLAGQFAGEREVKRFRSEAQAVARLDHPNIVPIYEFGELEGRPFLSMRFVDGTNLADQMDGEPMEAHRLAQLMSPLARAIHYAHKRGVLHRDLKPANVLLDDGGQPHVTDFGLAKCLDTSDGLTLSGTMLGSPNYMSPEQAAGHPDRLTTAADIYSLGAIMYQLLTGRPPFRADTPLQTMHKVMEEQPVAPHVIHKVVDPELETICLKCMEKEPERRYGSAEALAEDLERWLRHEPIQARPIGALGRLGKWTRRNPGTAALVLLCGLAILAFLVGQTVMSFRLSRANTKAQAANADLTRGLYEAQWRRADDAVREGEPGEAIARFSHFLHENPNDATAAARLLSLLSSCNFPVLLIPPLVHEAPVLSMDFNQAGDRLATATTDGTARLWNLESGKVEFEQPHRAPLVECLLCGENTRLRMFTISTEPKARLWDLATRRLISELELGPLTASHEHHRVIPARDRGLIAIEVRSNAVQVLDTDTGGWVQAPMTSLTRVLRFVMSADGRLAAIGSGREVGIWNVRNGQKLFAPVELTAPPLDVCFSDDGRWLACLCQNKISLINTVTGTRGHEFAAELHAISFLGATERLITISNSSSASLRLIDARTGVDCGSPFGQPQFDAQRHGALLFSPRELSYLPRTLRLLDPANGQFQTEPFIHDGPFCAVRLSTDGRVVATASQDRTVRIWSSEMRRPEPLTLSLRSKVYDARWSPSGDKIMTMSGTGDKGELRLWDARTGAVLNSAESPDGPGLVGQWTSDGTRVASASQKSAVIWDANTCRPLCVPLKHNALVVSCAFTPNGELFATAGEDNTIRLWNGHTGIPVGPPLVHPNTPFEHKLQFRWPPPGFRKY